MATQNRSETATTLNIVYQPTLAIATERTEMLQLASDMCFRKDVIASQVTTGDNITVDYTAKDMRVVDCATTNFNANITFSGLDNGDVKYLLVSKNSGKTISFANALDNTDYPTRTLTLTSCLYAVYSKNGVLQVKLLTKTVDSRYNAQNLLLNAPYSTSTIKIQADEFGWLNINSGGGARITISGGSYSAGFVIGNLPAGFIPNQTWVLPLPISNVIAGTYSVATCTINTSGEIIINVGFTQTSDLYFNYRIKLVY